jgi:WD40 repeat protein
MFNPAGSGLMTASYRHLNILRNDGTVTTLAGVPKLIDAAWSPDGMVIVTASSKEGVGAQIHAVTGGAPRTLEGSTAAGAYAVAFSPDNTRVATASKDGAVRIWRVEDGRALAILRPERDGALQSAAFSPNGRYVIAGGASGAYLWLADGRGQPEQIHAGPVIDAGFDARGKWIIVVAGSRNAARVVLYPVDGSGEPVAFKGFARISAFGPLDPAGRRVVTFSPQEHLAFVYPLDGGGHPTPLGGHTQLVLDATFSPDGRRVVTASSDWSIRLWDPETGREIDRFEGAGTEVELARFSPDGSTIVTYSAEHMIRLWDLAGRIIRKVQAEGAPAHVEFSRDGSKLLIVENGFRGHRLVRVVSTQTEGDPMLLTGHTERLRHAVFSPDGRRIATASEDGTAKIYAIDWPFLRRTLLKRSPVVHTGTE